MTVRDSFVEHFGEAEAQRIEEAAESHENGANGANKGSDPFKWAFLICVGYECISRDKFRDHHGIQTPHGDLQDWAQRYGSLDTHDGDFDYLSLLVGAYDEYMPVEAA